MEQPGLDGRHRTLLGRISQKHGNTLISTLRREHGAHFLPGVADNAKLEDVLHKFDEPSLTQLEHHYKQDVAKPL